MTPTVLYFAKAATCLVLAYAAWRHARRLHILAYLLAALIAAGLAVGTHGPEPAKEPAARIILL